MEKERADGGMGEKRGMPTGCCQVICKDFFVGKAKVQKRKTNICSACAACYFITASRTN